MSESEVMKIRALEGKNFNNLKGTDMPFLRLECLRWLLFTLDKLREDFKNVQKKNQSEANKKNLQIALLMQAPYKDCICVDEVTLRKKFFPNHFISSNSETLSAVMFVWRIKNEKTMFMLLQEIARTRLFSRCDVVYFVISMLNSDSSVIPAMNHQQVFLRRLDVFDAQKILSL